MTRAVSASSSPGLVSRVTTLCSSWLHEHEIKTSEKLTDVVLDYPVICRVRRDCRVFEKYHNLVNREEVPVLGVHGVEVQPGVGEQHGGVVDGVQGLGDARRELGVQAGKQGACTKVFRND